MNQILQGKVVGVYITPQDTPTLASVHLEEAQVTLEGFLGDRHAGFTMLSGGRTPFYPRGTEIRNNRQVSLVSAEELEAVAREMGVPALQAEWLGANLLLEGIPEFSRLPVGTRLFFPENTTLWVTAENFPCLKAGNIIQSMVSQEADLAARFMSVAMGRRGLVACVERAGVIRVGDAVQIMVAGGSR